MRPLPSQLSHFSLVLGSVPVPEQTGHVWNPSVHRIMVRFVIAVTSEGAYSRRGPWAAVLWSSTSLATGKVAGHDSRETIP